VRIAAHLRSIMHFCTQLSSAAAQHTSKHPRTAAMLACISRRYARAAPSQRVANNMRAGQRAQASSSAKATSIATALIRTRAMLFDRPSRTSFTLNKKEMLNV
jgi:hypothetical protein